jgi:hypothetical protein
VSATWYVEIHVIGYLDYLSLVKQSRMS